MCVCSTIRPAPSLCRCFEGLARWVLRYVNLFTWVCWAVWLIASTIFTGQRDSILLPVADGIRTHFFEDDTTFSMPFEMSSSLTSYIPALSTLDCSSKFLRWVSKIASSSSIPSKSSSSTCFPSLSRHPSRSLQA